MNRPNLFSRFKKLSPGRKMALGLVLAAAFIQWQEDMILEAALRQSIHDRNPRGTKELFFVSVNGHNPSLTFPLHFMADDFRITKGSQLVRTKNPESIPYGVDNTDQYTGERGTPIRLTFNPLSFPPKVNVDGPGSGCVYIMGLKYGHWAVSRTGMQWIA